MTRWGIYGPGRIAGKFAEAIRAIPSATIMAVAGRTPAKAKAFAQQHGVPQALPDLNALAQAHNIDAVYIATTHNVHCAASCTCLQAGKAVLCEKPLAMNAREVQRMTQTARAHNTFLMEALWTRFLPAWQRVKALITDGAIGTPNLLQANFGFSGNLDPAGRLLNKQQAGGALLDLGIYPVSMAQWLLPGPIQNVQATSHIGPTDVDTRTAMVLCFQQHAIALLSCAVNACTENHLVLAGDQGQIIVKPPFWAATEFTYTIKGQDSITESYPLRHNGFEEEIEEVHRCLHAGLQESPIMPLADSLATAQILDAVRQHIGLQYPADSRS